MTELGTELGAPKPRAGVSVLTWSGPESACRQILSLLFFFATIRFISPSDLGVVSLGVALTGIFAIFIAYVGYSVTIRSLYLLRDQSLFIVAGTLGDLKTVGYLSLAMRIARTLGQSFEEVTSRPLVSLISRQQNELTQFGDVLRTVLHVIGLIAFPSLIGLPELGTPVVSTFIGVQWAQAGHFLPWICAGMSGWLFLHVVDVALRALSFRSLVQIWAAPATASAVMLLSLRLLEGRQSPGVLGLLALIFAGAVVYGTALLTLSWRSNRSRLQLAGISR